MLNPFDRATFVSGTILFSAVGIVTGNSPVLAIILNDELPKHRNQRPTFAGSVVTD
jgi:hypothetical protein